MIYLWTIYYWILDEWCNDDEMFKWILDGCCNDYEMLIEFLMNVEMMMKLLMFWNDLLRRIYIIVLRWITNRLWVVNWVVMKLGCSRLSNLLWNVDCDCWLTWANDIQNKWPGYYWLALVNGIRDGWPGCDCRLALANGIQDGQPDCDCWLALANDIQNE
jgi:hypothetical protein